MRIELLYVFMAVLTLAVLAGCGGSSSLTKPQDTEGKASFILDWPANRQTIPGAIKSIRIELTMGSTLLKSRVCSCPTTGGSMTETFEHLPFGTVNYTATAFDQPSGIGMVIGSASGSLVITPGKDPSVTLATQLHLAVSQVSISAPSTDVRVDESLTLQATATTDSGTVVMANIAWSSNNADIATVNNQGKVTGINPGSVTITAKEPTSGKSDTVHITVIGKPAAVTVTISPSNPTIKEQETITLTAVAKDDTGQTINTPISWHSLNSEVATVDSYGTVTGIRAGSAVIKAVDDISSSSATMSVLVTADNTPHWVGNIAYYSSGNNEVYRIDASGAGNTQLTTSSVPDVDPVFNRAGTQIAYVSGNGGNRSIYLMNADGSHAQRITSSGDCSDPAFSPDGRKIAYSSNASGTYDIHIYDLGTGQSTQVISDAAEDYHPSFSRDGARLAFSSNRDGNYEIYIMNIDGSNIQRLTQDAGWDGMPVCSPTDDTIAFVTNRVNGVAYQTHLMGLDGSNLRRVLNVSHCSRMPAFSPDGQQLIFSANPNNQFDLYIAHLDGSGFTLLLGGNYNQMHASWAP